MEISLFDEFSSSCNCLEREAILSDNSCKENVTGVGSERCLLRLEDDTSGGDGGGDIDCE